MVKKPSLPAPGHRQVVGEIIHLPFMMAIGEMLEQLLDETEAVSSGMSTERITGDGC